MLNQKPVILWRKYTFSLIITLLSLAVHSQRLWEVPPGTVKINDSLFIDKAPIDNLMYREFTDKVKVLWNYKLHDSLRSLELREMDESLFYHSLDTSENKEIYERAIIAKNLKLPNRVKMYDYFNQPEYRYKPVTGISKDLAQLFCQWRTDMVNLRWSMEVKNSDHSYYKIKYRLPSPEEYQKAKSIFLKREKLVLISEDSPLEVDLKTLRNTDNFIFFNTSEFTAGNTNFKENSFKSEQDNSSDDEYIFFRCICEVEK